MMAAEGRYDGDRRRRSRSRSRDRGRDRRRSRSPRRDRDRDRDRGRSPPGGDGGGGYDPKRPRRRPTWFDIAPVNGVPPPPHTLPGAVQVTLAGAPPPVAGGFSAATNAQATRHARRIYIGGLPESCTEAGLSATLSDALAAVGGAVAGPGPAVVSTYLNADKHFAFVELRTVEECSNALALDGLVMDGAAARIRRPADYNAALAAPLGPALPNPGLNLAAVGLAPPAGAAAAAAAPPPPGAEPYAGPPPLDPAAAAAAAMAAMGAPPGAYAPPPAPYGAPPAPGQPPPPAYAQQLPPPQQQQPNASGKQDRVFIGGLPYYLDDAQVRELFAAFGAVREFSLVRDRATGESKGYGFAEFEDPALVDIACDALHGTRMGDRAITVRRAETARRDAAPPPAPVYAASAYAGAEGLAPPVPHAAMYTAAPPRVVRLDNAVTPEELADDAEYADIVEDMREECSRYGAVAAVHVPRPRADGGPPPPGVGKVLVEFAEPAGALAARNAMHGRRFGGRAVMAALVTAEDYAAGRWD